jgi:hypothetical protein
MISLLHSIVSNFVCWVETGVMVVLNLVIAGLGGLVTAMVAILPDMPDLPATPTWFADWMGWVGYWFPMAYFLELLAAVIVFRIAWFVARIPLRWAKANPS